jgi:hypothetical protein
VLAGLAVVVAAGGVVLWPRADRVTRENFDRIREGMTRTEVEAILGPPGDGSSGPLEFRDFLLRFDRVNDYYRPSSSEVLGGKWQERVEWLSDQHFVSVCFLQSGHVRTKSCDDVRRKEQSTFDNILFRAKRQWHRWFPE